MRGLIPSLNTPFDASGELHDASLRRLVEHTVTSGCNGMLGLAVAGEFASMSMDEKVTFVEIVAEQNHHRIPFIVSVTASDIADSLALARQAARAGADGICLQVPDCESRKDRIVILEKVADSGPPILMIQDLDWMGNGLGLDEIVEMYHQIEKFSWLKIETAFAGPKYTAVMDATEGRLNVCGGWTVMQLMDALDREVHGFMPTGLEAVYRDIYNLYQNRDFKGARSRFERLLPVLAFSNQHIEVSIRFFKSLRKAEGLFISDHCRAPMRTLDAIQKKQSEHALKLALLLQQESAR